jgi:O-Antigen ligase
MAAMDRLSAWGDAALTLLPGAALVYFAFESGGFFPGSQAFVALFLLQILLVRTLFAENPFAGFSRPLGLAVAAMAAYCAWTLGSALWSHSPGRAVVEFNRAFVYLLFLVVMGCAPRSGWRFAWVLRGLAAGIVIVCACGLITRALPHVWPIAPNVANRRLSYPVSYWNALGVIAATGIVLCFHIASSLRERVISAALGAAAIPVLATTLYFTFSRGAMAALAIALVVYLLVGRPQALAGAVLAIVPATVIAVVVAYHANLLATPDPTTAAAVHQGHRVALVVAICAAAAGLARWPLRAVDRRLTRRRLLPAIAARTRWAALAVVILVAVVVAVAAGAPSSLAHQYDRFVAGASTNTQDLRARLLDPSSNGRSQHWKVAINAFSNAAFKGHGAGSYELDWDLHRPNGVRVLDAHGLYFETASELGLVGTALLVVVIFVVLGGLTMRSLGPRRSLEAALLAAALVWVVHAGVDWDWEVAATTFPFFAIGGLVLARPATLAENQPGWTPQRPLIAVGVVAAAVMPFLLLGSQTRLDTSADAFRRDDCAKANSKALSSISILPFRPEP